ncbi:hypothetical protein N326_04724, partial [Eurypyga helias]
ANWRQFAAATAAAISLLRALLGPVLDRLWKHQEEVAYTGMFKDYIFHVQIHSPCQTTAFKYLVGQEGRGYCCNLHHTCSVACKLQSSGTAMLPAPSNKAKTEGTSGKL